jgi:hypothetical protein
MASHFSKGETALPRDEKDTPDFQAKHILTLSYLVCRELKRGNSFPFFKGRIRASQR